MYNPKAYIHPWREWWFNIVWELSDWRARCWWIRLYNWFRFCSLPWEREECCRRNHPGRNWKLVSAGLAFWFCCRLSTGMLLSLINVVLVNWNLDSQLKKQCQWIIKGEAFLVYSCFCQYALGLISQRSLSGTVVAGLSLLLKEMSLTTTIHRGNLAVWIFGEFKLWYQCCCLFWVNCIHHTTFMVVSLWSSKLQNR